MDPHDRQTLLRNTYVPNPDYGRVPNAPQMIWAQVDEHGNISYGADYSGCGIVFLPVPLLFFLPLAYPITAALVGGTWWFANELTQYRFKPWPDWAKWSLWIGPAFVVFVICMRIEQRLGEYELYRWPRYVVRVVLPALLLQLVARQDMNDPSVTRDPDLHTFFRETLNNRDLLFGTAVGVVIMVVLYWIGGWMRGSWHAFLRKIGLRSSKLPN